MGGEANLPTWFTVALWLFAAAVVALYSLVGQHRGTWRLLAVTCVLLSVDEAAMLHENLHLLGSAMGVDRWAPTLPYTWVVPGALAALLLAVIFGRAILGLPRVQRALVLLAGALFVGGAIGVEILGGLAMRAGPSGYLAYTVLTAIEETLEMMSVGLFACAMVSLFAVTRAEQAVIRVALVQPLSPRPRALDDAAVAVTQDGTAPLHESDPTAEPGGRRTERVGRAADPVVMPERRSA